MEAKDKPNDRSLDEILGKDEKGEFLRTFAFSFRFSQGNNASDFHQKHLFEAIKFFRPEWANVPNNTTIKTEILDYTLNMLDRMELRGNHSVASDTFISEADKRVDQFLAVLNRPTERGGTQIEFPHRLLKVLMGRTVDADYYYLLIRKNEGSDDLIGRPNQLDPWGSQFVSYVINEEQTGSPVFDKIFAELSEYLRSGGFQREMPNHYEDASAIVHAYNAAANHKEKGIHATLPDITVPATMQRSQKVV